MAAATAARTVTFGQAAGSTVRFSIVGVNDEGCCTVDFTSDGTTSRTELTVPGVHMASNACAAVAVGIVCGIPLATAVKALAGVEMAGQRVQWRRSASGLRILDDTYNANPSSMIAALHTLAACGGVNQVAVLGAMAEISDPPGSHRLPAARPQRGHLTVPRRIAARPRPRRLHRDDRTVRGRAVLLGALGPRRGVALDRGRARPRRARGRRRSGLRGRPDPIAARRRRRVGGRRERSLRHHHRMARRRSGARHAGRAGIAGRDQHRVHAGCVRSASAAYDTSGDGLCKK